MATQLQIRRGTSAQIAAFTGAEGEIVVNTTNDSVHVNDGSTAGGFEMARADLNNVSDTDLNAALTGNTVSALTITTLTLGATAITATGTELNYVDGVTSAIQTQIDTKAPLASPTFTGTVTADGGTIVSTGSDAFSSKAVGGYAIQAYQDATSSGHTALDLRSDSTTSTRYLIRGYNDAAGTPTEVFSVGADGGAYLSGNVGIGTSSPNAGAVGGKVIHVQNSGATASVRVDRSDASTSGTLAITSGNTTNGLFSTGSKALSISTNSTEAMRIDSSGSLLVGETSSNPYGGLTTAHVFTGASSTGGAAPFGIYNSTGTANVPVLNLLSRDASTDTTSRFLQFYANVTSSTNTAMGGIVGNGASNVQFASISDVREKENITTISGSLSKITSLNPVEFDWIASGEHCKAGFVAQEVEEVFPEFVVENMASEGQEERKGLTGGMTGGIVAHLVKAIQEQQATIESQATAITDLTTRLTALENN